MYIKVLMVSLLIVILSTHLLKSSEKDYDKYLEPFSGLQEKLTQSDIYDIMEGMKVKKDLLNDIFCNGLSSKDWIPNDDFDEKNIFTTETVESIQQRSGKSIQSQIDNICKRVDLLSSCIKELTLDTDSMLYSISIVFNLYEIDEASSELAMDMLKGDYPLIHKDNAYLNKNCRHGKSTPKCAEKEKITNQAIELTFLQYKYEKLILSNYALILAINKDSSSN